MSALTLEAARELAAAYALGVLSHEESRMFEAVLESSPELRLEVAEYREVNALLALQQQTTISPNLKTQLLGRVGATKVGVLTSSPRRPVLTWVLSGALAASVLVAVGLGRRVREQGELLTDQDARLSAAAAKLAGREKTLNTILEPDVELVQLTTTGEAPPVVQIFWNRKTHSAIMHTFRMKPAPAGRAYQLWFIRNGKPVPSKVFNPEPSGRFLAEGIDIPTDQGVTGYAVTEEPAAGSLQPTTPILVFGKVATS